VRVRVSRKYSNLGIRYDSTEPTPTAMMRRTYYGTDGARVDTRIDQRVMSDDDV